MRAITVVLAVAAVLATSTMAGSAPDTLPNAGLFAFEAPSASVVVASR